MSNAAEIEPGLHIMPDRGGWRWSASNGETGWTQSRGGAAGQGRRYLEHIGTGRPAQLDIDSGQPLIALERPGERARIMLNMHPRLLLGLAIGATSELAARPPELHERFGDSRAALDVALGALLETFAACVDGAGAEALRLAMQRASVALDQREADGAVCVEKSEPLGTPREIRLQGSNAVPEVRGPRE